MFKWNDKVIVTKDNENEGFYIGLTGLLKERTKSDKGIKYAMEVEGSRYFWVDEEDIQKI